MKITTMIIPLLFVGIVTPIQITQAAAVSYNVSVVFLDDTTFTGSFKYDAKIKKISNLQGLLDDVLMGDIVWLNKQLTWTKDSNGGITASVYAMNTKAIRTDPPINNNAYVTINFNALDPSLGATNLNKLAYMDCTPGALMGQTCMYDLSWHKPVIPMEGGHGTLSIKITPKGKTKTSRAMCFFDWAENTYSEFSPIGVISQPHPLSSYRYYPESQVSLGISSADSHVYYQGIDGSVQDWGHLSTWLDTAGCE